MLARDYPVQSMSERQLNESKVASRSSPEWQLVSTSSAGDSRFLSKHNPMNKTHLPASPVRSLPRQRILSSCAAFAALLVASSAAFGPRSQAADIPWDGGAAGTGTAWRTAANWLGDVAPANLDNAIFDSVGTVTTCAIDLGAAGGTQQVGAVTMGPGRANNLSIRNLTTSTADGVLVLNGIGGILLSNGSTTASLTFTNASTGRLLGLGLASAGDIYATDGGGTAGQIAIFSSISDVGGAHHINKIGAGILYLRGVNTYAGDTTVSEGTLEVDDVGTIGNGTGTLFLSGGNLLSGASRSGTSAAQQPVANPIVLTTDAYLFNRAGNANTTRYLALAGSLSGSAGTLKIANPTVNLNQTFAVRLFGGFTFNRPVLVGETAGAFADLIGSYSVLELINNATNGVQTFNGDISGVGSIRRTNAYPSEVPGVTVFTGNNTYSGGTLINGGTIFANNSSGSALGSGDVNVLNQGTLAGNGAVVALTTVSTNGVIAPGATATAVGNLAVSQLTLGPGANYSWQITAATGVAGTSWDLITCSSGWTDAGDSGNPITIKVDSLGSAPTGWNPGISRDWVLIQSSSATGFDESHFALDTTAFSGTVQGVFSLSVVSGSLHLTYTPAADIVLNVPAGSVTQGQTTPTPYPLLTGTFGVLKVGNGEVVFTNAANDYAGATKVYAGTASLAVDSLNGSGAFGAASTAVLLGNTTGNSNATLNIKTDGVTLARAVVVQSGSTGSKTVGTTLTSGTATYSGDVTLLDNATLSAPAGGGAVFSGNITGAGGLTLGGGGTLTLSALNSYAGPTTLTGGTLNLNNKGLGTNTFTIAAPSILDNTSAGSVTLNTCPQIWNADFSFTGTANLNLGPGAVTLSATRTLTVNNNTLTIGGPIAGNAGLVKLGAGILQLSGSASTYTGGTTNSAGVIGINGTATLGDGNGTLLLNGGSILSTGTRSGAPLTNPVRMTADTTIYGNSTAAAPSSRILPFSGTWTIVGGTLRIGNTGLAGNTFVARFTAGSDVTQPVIVGDPAFDTPGAICQLQFYNDNTTPVQLVSGVISGNGEVWRGHLLAGAGGTSIFTGNNTFAGGFVLDSGALGIGLNSTPTSGAVTSGPLGTGTFEIDNDPSITIFASGGARTIGNNIFLNGVVNTVFSGTNALTFTGDVNLGGVAKTLTTINTAPTTFSGALTNSAALIKSGAGTLVLSGDNSSRTNTTTVNDGTLLVNNITGSGTGSGDVIVNSPGTLGGTGSIDGAVTVNVGGTLAPGASIGTLTINNNLILSGNLNVEVNKSVSPSNDLVVVTGTINNISSGTVNVSNLGGSLSVGDSFKLFNQAVINGGALTVTGGGVTWTNKLAVDGSIQVLSTGGGVPPSFPPNSVAILPGGNISLTATGSLGTTYKLWASTNVALTPITNTWTLLSSGTVTASPFTINDLTATNHSQRFYLFSVP